MAELLLKKFRELMTLRNLNIFVLPRTDEHQSEYLCACDERVKFISGFTGSMAIALISQSEALLWTDSRYYLQAENELHEGWQMRKLAEGEKPWFEHIAVNYPKGSTVGIDANLLSADSGINRGKFLTQKEFVLQFMNENLVDVIWEHRPPVTATPIYLHEQWAGKSIVEKVEWVRTKINTKKGSSAVFNDLSEIAWLLNLRSSQIPCSPFFKGVLIIEPEGGSLYLPSIHKSLKDEKIISHLLTAKITLREYYPAFGEKALIVKSQLNFNVYRNLKEPIEWEGIGLYRAVRTDKELQGFRRAHLVDGVAMAKFWSWRSQLQEVDQYDAAMHMDELRKQQEHNMGISFQTISAGGPNGAVVHYHPQKGKTITITKQMVHLVDSGGQYLDGTTDVTRAFHFGQPTQEEKSAFTRVLLGNLDIERLKWPKPSKIAGQDIDVLARRHLWSQGLDYGHGTGHGVGYFEGVHEGPVGISKRNSTVFEPGMIVTNEPGYYESGKFGIRIENILVVVEKQGCYGFENLTLCPYDRNLIDLNLLTPADVNYINAYHAQVYQQLSQRLKDDEKTIIWLKYATSPL